MLHARRSVVLSAKSKPGSAFPAYARSGLAGRWFSRRLQMAKLPELIKRSFLATVKSVSDDVIIAKTDADLEVKAYPADYVAMQSVSDQPRHFLLAIANMPRQPLVGERLRANVWVNARTGPTLKNWTFAGEIKEAAPPSEVPPPEPKKKAPRKILFPTAAAKVIASACNQINIPLLVPRFLDLNLQRGGPPPGYYPTSYSFRFHGYGKMLSRDLLTDVREAEEELRHLLVYSETAFVRKLSGVVQLLDRHLVDGFHTDSPSVKRVEAEVIRGFDFSNLSHDGFWYLKDGRWYEATYSIYTPSPKLHVKGSETDVSFVGFKAFDGSFVKASVPAMYKGIPIRNVILRVATPDDRKLVKGLGASARTLLRMGHDLSLLEKPELEGDDSAREESDDDSATGEEPDEMGGSE